MEVMYIPDINLKIDLDKEAEMFVKFLHHEKFTQNKESILRYYPDLRLLLENDMADEAKIIRSFLESKYSKHDVAIKSILSDAKEKINRHGKIILEQLSLLMDYTWPKEHPGYVVIPTVLPFSPFNENTFYFSMTRKIKGNNKKDDINHEILPLLAHEISHLMLKDILKQGEKRNIFGDYGWTTKHFLQEILAPILMNQEPLKNILGIEDYLGNPYLKNLNVEKNSVTENIVIYFKKIYETMKYTGNKPFTEIIKTMANELESISVALDEKFKMWNVHGHDIFSNNLLLQKYQAPISIK